MSESKKALYGLVGFPVGHSLSAAIHNAAFAACNKAAEYKLFNLPPNQLEDFLIGDIEIKDINGNSFLSQEVLGFNITIPHKVSAFMLLKEIIASPRPEVILAGAINTVKRGQKLQYANTDTIGFRKALVGKFSPENKNVLLIGCGGAGRAVMAGLNSVPAPAMIYIYEKNTNTAGIARNHFENFQKNGVLNFNFKFISQEELPEKIEQCQLLVNATPLGMKEGDSSPIDKDLLHKGLFVYDVVYNRDTELVRAALLKCQGASGGLDMLLYQGVAAWELWMGKKAPVETMRKALKEELNKGC